MDATTADLATRNSYTNLHEDIVVISIKIPDVPRETRFEQEDGTLVFMLQFGHTVPGRDHVGGFVNFFLHLDPSDDAADFIGKRIFVRATVVEKTARNILGERRFLLVDIHPLYEEEVIASHRLKVAHDVPEENDRVRVFPTPDPYRGAVVLTEISENARQAEPNPLFGVNRKRAPVATAPATAVITSVAQPEAKGTGDKMLDRLLAEGWNIETEWPDGKVTLVKDGRSIIHHRPKQKPTKR